MSAILCLAPFHVSARRRKPLIITGRFCQKTSKATYQLFTRFSFQAEPGETSGNWTRCFVSHHNLEQNAVDTNPLRISLQP